VVEGGKTIEALVVDAVAEIYDEKPETIRSGGRRKHEAEGRMLAYFVLNRKFQRSFPVIAAHFDRDRATIIHGCRRIENLLLYDIGLQAKLDHAMLLLGDLVQACAAFVITTVAAKPVDFVNPADRDPFQICRRCHLPRGLHAPAASAALQEAA
jgi:hypothetical protein